MQRTALINLTKVTTCIRNTRLLQIRHIFYLARIKNVLSSATEVPELIISTSSRAK